MFETGFFEIIVIAVIALLILGPDKLPGAMRQVGRAFRKARQSWMSVSQHISDELDIDEQDADHEPKK